MRVIAITESGEELAIAVLRVQSHQFPEWVFAQWLRNGCAGGSCRFGADLTDEEYLSANCCYGYKVFDL